MLRAAVELALVLLAALGLLSAVVVWAMARLLLRPPRMSDARAIRWLRRLAPSDIDLAYEECRFTVRDENGRALRLAAWWIPHADANGRCVVMLHGYADAKIGALAWAPTFHELGWNILALDLRAHGQSEGSVCTAGYHERHDIAQVIQQLRAERTADAQRVILFGPSLGGAVAAATARLMQENHETGVDALILDCPFADLLGATKMHMNLLGLPRGWLTALALRLAQWRSGADFRAISPVADIPQLTCPVMVINCALDPVVSPADAATLEAATLASPRNVFWRIEDAGHLMALARDAEEYRQRVGQFLS